MAGNEWAREDGEQRPSDETSEGVYSTGGAPTTNWLLAGRTGRTNEKTGPVRWPEAGSSGGQGSRLPGGAVSNLKRSWIAGRKNWRVDDWELHVEDYKPR